MVTFLSAALTYLRAFLVSCHNLGLEVAALRQQVTVYKRKQPRPKLHRFDRLFWMALRRLWTNWADTLVLGRVEDWRGVPKVRPICLLPVSYGSASLSEP